MENDLNDTFCLISMDDIRSADIKRLPKLHEQIVWKLARIEANINFCKKFKTNINAQKDLIYLKDDKKYYQGLKKQVEQRLKRKY